MRRRCDIAVKKRVAFIGIRILKVHQPRPNQYPKPQFAFVSRRLYCPYVFHYRNGKKIGDFRKKWNKACQAVGLTGVIVHDMRRSAARNLSLSGVKEQLAMKITGHKTNSMYRRYRIVDEDELRQAQEQQQAYLQSQMQTRKVVPLRTGT